MHSMLAVPWLTVGCCLAGCIQKLHAGLQLPAAEVEGVRGVLRLLGSP